MIANKKLKNPSSKRLRRVKAKQNIAPKNQDLPEMGLGGDVFAGAASGAATGAAIGGPWGALGGAVIGGATSYFSSKKRSKAEEEAKAVAAESQRLDSARQTAYGEYEGQQQYESLANFALGGETELNLPGFGQQGKGFEMAESVEQVRITPSVAFRRAQRHGHIPKEMKFSEFKKDPTSIHPYLDSSKGSFSYKKNNKGTYDYFKSRSDIQITEEDKPAAIKAGKDIKGLPVYADGGEYDPDGKPSDSYKFGFPHLRDFDFKNPRFVTATNKEGRMEEFSFSPARHTQRDSAYFHPVMNKLEGFLKEQRASGKELNHTQTKHIQHLLSVASAPSEFNEFKGSGQMPDEVPDGIKSLHNIFNAASNEELGGILGTDFKDLKGQSLGKKVKTAYGLVPDDASLKDIYKAGKYLSDDSFNEDLGGLNDLINFEVDKAGYLEKPEEFKKGGCVKTNRMAVGGVMPVEPNVEVEGGESIELPNGDNVNVEGPSHENGGIPMTLDKGSRVFSDRLKVPGSKDTFSTVNKKLTAKIDKYKKTLDDSYSTKISKRTAERMLSRLESDQDLLFAQQQDINGDSNGSTGQGELPKALDGAAIAQGVGTYAPAIMNMAEGLFGKPEIEEPIEYRNDAGQAAAARLRDRSYDAKTELDASRRAFTTGRRNISQTARSRGELMGNLGGLSAMEAQQESSIRSNKQNIENQYQSESAQMTANLGSESARQNTAIRQGVAARNSQARANQRNMLRTGLSQTSNILQSKERQSNLMDADKIRRDILSDIYANFELGDDNKFKLREGK